MWFYMKYIGISELTKNYVHLLYVVDIGINGCSGDVHIIKYIGKWKNGIQYISKKCNGNSLISWYIVVQMVSCSFIHG
jgi:hypothetical protein